MDLNDLVLRPPFYRTGPVKLFDNIKSSAKFKIVVAEELVRELKYYINIYEARSSFQVTESHKFYRARAHDYLQVKKFKTKDMGAPPSEVAKFARANVHGEAVLYMADSPSTAYGELRPDSDSFVSVGTFRPDKSKIIKVLHLNKFKAPNSEEDYLSFIKQMGELRDFSVRAFSEPTHVNDPRKYYAQALVVQTIRELGFDGVGYDSAVVDGGKCFAFFDESLFKCTRVSMYRIIRTETKAVPFYPSKIELACMLSQSKK